MKVIFITDIHGQFYDFIKLPQADLLLIGGDITLKNNGPPNEIVSFIKVTQQKYPLVYAVLGNCDPIDAELLIECLGVNLNNKIFKFNNWNLIGCSGSPPTPNNTPNVWCEYLKLKQLIHSYSNLSFIEKSIFVTHTPPYNSGADRLNSGTRAGSIAIDTFSHKLCNSIILCGHIHESNGIFCDDRTNNIVVNPGPFKNGYFAEILLEENIVPKVNLHCI